MHPESSQWTRVRKVVAQWGVDCGTMIDEAREERESKKRRERACSSGSSAEAEEVEHWVL